MKKTALCKRLLALFVCVFAFIGASAETFVSPNILELTPTDVNSKDFGNLTAENQARINNGTITTIKLVGNFSDGWSGYLLKKGDNWGSRITTIDLSAADFSGITATLTYNSEGKIVSGTVNDGKTQAWGFIGFYGLKTIIWPPQGKISVLPEDAFQRTGIESVSIPGYIRYIGQHAFDSESDMYLKKVVFEEYPDPATGPSQVEMYIATQAFNLTYGLMDVYVESLGKLTAGTNAFPHSKTYGHSDPTKPMATLHFPASKAADYVNLLDPLSPETANDDGAFQAWLANHYTKAGEAKNGFYEFVTNGPTPPKDAPSMGDVVLKTFSDAKLDYVVPNGVKAYIVNKVLKADEEENYRLLLQKVNVIPHGTGVIIYGGTNATTSDGKKRFLSLTAVNYTGGPYTYNSNVNYKWRNLLVGTAKEDGSSTHVDPYDMDMSVDTVTHRNFFMGKFTKSKSGAKYVIENPTFDAEFVGFFRAISSNIASGKAYLHVPAYEYPEPKGGEIIVPAQAWEQYATEFKPGQATEIYTEEELKAKGWWHKGENYSQRITWTDKTDSWGVRDLPSSYNAKFEGEPFFEDINDEEGVATLVVPASMVETTDGGDYYTLQGVKVSQPTKGVYIKNGKKVVIR